MARRSSFSYRNNDNASVSSNLLKSLNRHTAVVGDSTGISRMDSAYSKEFSLALNSAAGVEKYDLEVSEALHEFSSYFKTEGDSKINLDFEGFTNSLPLTHDNLAKIIEEFNNVYSKLLNSKEGLINESADSGSIVSALREINEICTQIQRLNSDIGRLENRRRGEEQLAEYRIERNNLQNRLCELINTKAGKNSGNSTISLNLQNGFSLPLVSGTNERTELQLQSDDENSHVLKTPLSDEALQLDSSGTLAGMLDVLTFSKDLIKEFDSFGSAFSALMEEMEGFGSLNYKEGVGFERYGGEDFYLEFPAEMADEKGAVLNMINSAVAQTQLLGEKFDGKLESSKTMKKMFEQNSGDLKTVVDSQQAFRAAEKSLNTLNGLLENLL